MGKRMYTIEENAFLMGFIPGHSYQESADAFNEKFPAHYRKVSPSMINAFCRRHKIKTGDDHRFKKGFIPANKGKKVPKEKQSIATQFKPGQCLRARPIGSERIQCNNGLTYIKVGWPRKWRLKHHVIWEQAHGMIPPGCVILFRDGNKQNFSLDNLALVTKSEHTYIIKTGIEWHDAEIFDALLMMAKIRMKIIDKEERRG